MTYEKSNYISFAFPELSAYTIRNHGSCIDYNWKHIVHPSKKDEYLFKEVLSNPDYIHKEVALFKALKSAMPLFLSKYCSPIIKYYIAPINRKATEVLQNYEGIPLTCSIVKPEKKFAFIDKILYEVATALKSCPIIIGNMAPEIILVHPKDNSIKFHGLYNGVLISPNKSNYRPEAPLSAFYLNLKNISQWSSKQAVHADALALLYALYYTSNDSSFPLACLKTDGSIDINNLVMQDEFKKHIEECKTYKILADIAATLDIDYDKILSYFTEPPVLTNCFETMPDSSIGDSLGFKKENIIIRKFHSHSVYLVHVKSLPTKQTFVLKKYKTSTRKEIEENVFKAIQNIKTTSLTKQYQREFGCELDQLELLIEFNGVSISSYFSKQHISAMNINELLNCIPLIMKSLSDAHMMHCDIKPSNISYSTATHDIQLFDYDTAIINIKDTTDSEQTFKVTGATLLYLAPEILKEMLSAKDGNLKINAYRGDLYSLAKSILCAIFGYFELADILNKFYGLQIESTSSYEYIIQQMEKSLSDYEKNNLIGTSTFPFNRVEALFYLHRNDQFLKIIQCLPKPPYLKENDFKDIIKYLCLLMSTDPAQRPTLEELNKYNFKLEISEEEIRKSLATPFDTKTILSNMNTDIIIKPQTIDWNNNAYQYYQPVIKSNHTFLYKISVGENVSYSQIEKVNNVIPASQFIQCPNSNYSCADLFSVGGNIDYIATNNAQKYEPTKKLFIKVASMNHSRYQFGSTAWPMHIAVSGGIGFKPSNIHITNSSSPILDSVEIYDAEKDAWRLLDGNMHEPRRSTVLVCIKSNLFVIGGIHQTIISNENKIADAPVSGLTKCNNVNKTTIDNIINSSIDIYDIVNGKLSKSIKITNKLYNSICDCLAIPLPGKPNEIILLKECLLNDKSDGKYQYALVLNEEFGEIKDDVKGAQAYKYLGYACSTFICLNSHSYLMMPDFYAEQSSNEFIQWPIKLVLNDKWVNQAMVLKAK